MAEKEGHLMSKTRTPEEALASLKKKILALLAKAERTEHEAEAAAFGAKARELMDEHRLTIRDVMGAEDEMGRMQIFCPYDDRAYVQMAAGGAAFLGCDLLMNMAWDDVKKRRRRVVIFVGRESARVTCELLVPFWWSQCNKIGRRMHREGHMRSAAASVHAVMAALGMRLFAESDRQEEIAEAEKYRGKVRQGRKTKIGTTWAAIDEAAKIPTSLQLA